MELSLQMNVVQLPGDDSTHQRAKFCTIHIYANSLYVNHRLLTLFAGL